MLEKVSGKSPESRPKIAKSGKSFRDIPESPPVFGNSFRDLPISVKGMCPTFQFFEHTRRLSSKLDRKCEFVGNKFL